MQRRRLRHRGCASGPPRNQQKLKGKRTPDFYRQKLSVADMRNLAIMIKWCFSVPRPENRYCETLLSGRRGGAPLSSSCFPPSRASVCLWLRGGQMIDAFARCLRALHKHHFSSRLPALTSVCKFRSVPIWPVRAQQLHVHHQQNGRTRLKGINRMIYTWPRNTFVSANKETREMKHP